MTTNSTIIIGAGIGGLSAGCYAQMNGYKTQIFELHNIPGGVCTSWKRKGYTFDGCIHHLAGSKPGSRIYRMWEELGAMPRQVYFPEDLICIENTEGKRFTIYTDIDRLEQHMLELAPQDAAATREFIGAARRFSRFDVMDMLLAKPWEMLGMLPNLGLMGKWGKVKLDDYAQRFSDPFLRRAFPMIQYDFPDIPMVVALMFLAGTHTGFLGFPAGGAVDFALSIAKRYRQLGGEIHYKSRVAKILVEHGPKGDRAVGVRLEDGSEHFADAVISNADGRTTIYEMLEGKYTTPLIRSYYENPPKDQVMSLHVSLGAARDMTREPHALVLWLPEPVCIAGEVHDRLDLEILAFAPEMAPEGKTSLKATFLSSYEYWKNLASQGKEIYDVEKQRVADLVVDLLDRRFPGLKAQVEVTDVATPLTTERFTGSYLGYQAWGIPNQSFTDAMSGKGLSKTLPGLENFQMVGQWAGGLGIPNVAAMGRKAVESLCKRDGKRFVTSKAG